MVNKNLQYSLIFLQGNLILIYSDGVRKQLSKIIFKLNKYESLLSVFVSTVNFYFLLNLNVKKKFISFDILLYS